MGSAVGPLGCVFAAELCPTTRNEERPVRHVKRDWNRRTALSISIASVASLALIGGAVAVQGSGNSQKDPVGVIAQGSGSATVEAAEEEAIARAEIESSPEDGDRRGADPADEDAASVQGDGVGQIPTTPQDAHVADAGAADVATAGPVNAAGDMTRPGEPTAAAVPPAPVCGAGTFDAEAVKGGETWTARRGEQVLYTGPDMLTAMASAIGSLDPQRTSKQRVVVRGSGTMPASAKLRMPSFTILDVCGTIDAVGPGARDTAPIFARGVTDIEIRHLKVTGTPMYGIFLRSVENVTLGQIDLDMPAGGLGIRIDNYGNRSVPTRNVRIDDVRVTAGSHGVETFGVDGLVVGSVVARSVGGSGLLLNATTNAEIGLVDAIDAGTGTGYAAFRTANGNGRIGEAYPVNIHVEKVVARGGGRGVFCVSDSGGLVIDEVDIADTGNHAILLENCHNVTIKGGTVSGPGELRLAARWDRPNSTNITLENLTVRNTVLREAPCAENTTTRGLTFVDATDLSC